MRLILALYVLLLSSASAFAQELGLRQYLQLLRVAPGTSIEQKVDYLSSRGIYLSDQGLRELQGHTTPTVPSTTWSPPAYIPRSVPSSSTSTRLGRFTFYNSDDGTTGWSTELGNFRFYNFGDGTSGSSTKIGGFTLYNFNGGLSGTSHRIGDFTFHHFSDGVSGTSNRIGGFTFHNFSDGRSCTSNQIGQFTFNNCR